MMRYHRAGRKIEVYLYSTYIHIADSRHQNAGVPGKRHLEVGTIKDQNSDLCLILKMKSWCHGEKP